MLGCFHTINLKALYVERVCPEMPGSALRYLVSNWGRCKCQRILSHCLGATMLKTIAKDLSPFRLCLGSKAAPQMFHVSLCFTQS